MLFQQNDAGFRPVCVETGPWDEAMSLGPVSAKHLDDPTVQLGVDSHACSLVSL